MSIDELVRLILGVAVAISVLGISIQLMRLLGTFNAILQDVRYLAYQVGEFVGKLKGDYDMIISKVSGLLDPLEGVKGDLLDPIARLAKLLGGFVKAVNSRLGANKAK